MSNIEWTDKTWNPVIGCTPVSPGCLNCYAATMARRLQANPAVPEYAPRLVDERGNEHRGAVPEDRRATLKAVRIAEVRGGRAVFTGEVRTLEGRLAEPLSWRKPCRVFVNSMSDLFHESVPFEFVDRVFAVMALCPQHTFQVLTKRPERMAEYLRSIADEDDVAGSWGMMRLGNAAGDLLDGEWIHGEGKRHRTSIEHFISDTHEIDDEDSGYEAQPVAWPLPNVWCGTSVEDQARADERVPHLLRCPAAVRFLSCEPLLGPVKFSRIKTGVSEVTNVLTGNWQASDRIDGGACVGWGDKRIHWVIVGGESGPGSRPCDVAWIRDIVRQCRASGVACFVKQLGAEPITRTVWWPASQRGGYKPDTGHFVAKLRDRKGGDPAEWPEDLRVREMPGGEAGGTPAPRGLLKADGCGLEADRGLEADE
jgi:protein gp37